MGRFNRLLLLIVVSLFAGMASATGKNGFDLDNALIPADNIHHGGPPRDGIPSLDSPRFVSAEQAGYMQDEDRVLGITHKGVARAYPIKILNWHEIVNDRIKGDAVVVTFCPLCGTGLVYDGNIDGRLHNFGVSGLLYNSDVLLYDRETESLWSQILSQAVAGAMKGRTLKSLPVSHTSWASWYKEHPDTQVLSTETGFHRDYTRSPYGEYTRNEQIYFPLTARSREYHPKERVLGITVNGKHKAYPFIELAKLEDRELQDEFAGEKLTIRFDVENRDGRIVDGTGEIVETVNGFWFAWYAFHEDTEIFQVE